jgi:hypothetical protein
MTARADSPPDIEDDLDPDEPPDESQTVSRSLDEREIQYPGLRLAYRGRTLCTSPDQSS